MFYYINMVIVFAKKTIVMFGNKILTKGEDYTVSYKNNAKVNDGSVTNTVIVVTVTGKGNYTNGTLSTEYRIRQQQSVKLL